MQVKSATNRADFGADFRCRFSGEASVTSLSVYGKFSLELPEAERKGCTPSPPQGLRVNADTLPM